MLPQLAVVQCSQAGELLASQPPRARGVVVVVDVPARDVDLGGTDQPLHLVLRFRDRRHPPAFPAPLDGVADGRVLNVQEVNLPLENQFLQSHVRFEDQRDVLRVRADQNARLVDDQVHGVRPGRLALVGRQPRAVPPLMLRLQAIQERQPLGGVDAGQRHQDAVTRKDRGNPRPEPPVLVAFERMGAHEGQRHRLASSIMAGRIRAVLVSRRLLCPPAGKNASVQSVPEFRARKRCRGELGRCGALGVASCSSSV